MLEGASSGGTVCYGLGVDDEVPAACRLRVALQKA